jgi:hypothetical protein
MREQWALLDSNQRASDYESRAGSLQCNDLAARPRVDLSQAVAICRTLSHPMVTDLVTAPESRRGARCS